MKLNTRTLSFSRIIAIFAALIAFAAAAYSQANLTVNADASEVFRNLIRVRETVDAHPGDFQLFYPKWIPGEHSPTGTINDVVNLYFTANGQPLKWRRDDVEMFAFHVDVPRGVRQVEVRLDYVSQPGTVATANLARIKWNRLVLYPRGMNSDNVRVTSSLTVPAGWDFATALDTTNKNGNAVNFSAVDLTTFIDSPAIVGRYFTKVPLATEGGVPIEMDIAGETPESIRYDPQTLAGWKNLAHQAYVTFGGRHYRKYHFLLTLSDYGGSEGLEHHESSEDGEGEKALTEPAGLVDLGDLLGHEYTHSWNGKYRRPANLTTPDFEKPMVGEMLWVYEGLTQYLGHVLPARSGLWTPEVFRESLADTAAGMDEQSGRRWRPLVDTARAVQFTYSSPRAWMSERRRVDYYDEGSLIWLEADVLIRQRSNGRLSLDDFLHRFHGRQNSGPAVVTYDLNEIVSTLNQILPYDWRTFFEDRVYSVREHAPLGGITNGGWTLVYNSTPNLITEPGGPTTRSKNLMYSIGLIVNSSGEIRDIRLNSPAGRAGLAPGMRITKIGDANFSIENITRAVDATAGGSSSIRVAAVNGGQTANYDVAYTGGERYPHLVRRPGVPDLLTAIGSPH